ncbi:M14 metallopeptidase family protein [uncultured Flavobacterium sp.]|uniref:M14 family metallopeptidase n=1 Tax=uncultured Flavobacterium sp. TaxID=165435 RepID=UPI0025E2B763|nr:M14 metallopeptidase family protein [uncultured Flavobacterium sp.]
MDFEKFFEDNRQKALLGRYITLKDIEPILAFYKKGIVTEIGKSVEGKSIYSYQIGTGKIKILMWSQMHGNESTTTKALFDLLNVLNSDYELANKFLEEYTFYCIPILNPDGAKNYTRVNANEIDLNRDFQNLTQPESNLLMEVYKDFKPDFCYNLHDQRTIFAAGNTRNPATVSFLAPSYNDAREINDVRKKAMCVIAAMNAALQEFIPNQVGRFDDGFNLNCVGDTFQYLKTPTVLFEAGHFPNDYQREETRKYIFIALISGLQWIYENDIVCNETDNYFNIPQNMPVFYDFIYKNIKIYYDNKQLITNFAFQFKEVLEGEDIKFVATLVEIGELKENFGHFEFDADGAAYSDEEDNIPKLEQNIDFYLGEKVKIVNGLPKV